MGPGSCTRSCGGGIQFLTKTCTNPKPSLNGADCVGETKQLAAREWCNTHVSFRSCLHDCGLPGRITRHESSKKRSLKELKCCRKDHPAPHLIPAKRDHENSPLIGNSDNTYIVLFCGTILCFQIQKSRSSSEYHIISTNEDLVFSSRVIWRM